MKRQQSEEDFVLYLHTVEAVCQYVRSTKFRGADTVEDILVEGLGMPNKVANEFICCIAYSYQKGMDDTWREQQKMIEEKLDTISYPQKLWSKLLTFLPSALTSTEVETGKEVSSMDECSEPLCDTPGLGGEENLSTRRMGSITWHQSRSVH